MLSYLPSAVKMSHLIIEPDEFFRMAAREIRLKYPYRRVMYIKEIVLEKILS